MHMNRNHLLFVLAAALVCGSFGCGSTRPVARTGTARPVSFSGPGPVAPGGPVSASYHLQVDDQVEVQYYVEPTVNHTFRFAPGQHVDVKFVEEPRLNESQVIRSDGHLSLPYLGDVLVVGRTVEVVTSELKERYAPILPSPELYIVVREEPMPQDLQIANEQERRLLVRPDGYAGFPRVGDVPLAGRTVADVAEDLNRRYAVVHPGLRCNLRLREHAESMVYVMGHVMRPGAYPMGRSLDVLKALSLAGGNAPGADLSNVVVMRAEDGDMKMKVLDVEKTVMVASGAQYMMLEPDDMVYVATGSLAEKAEFARTLADVLFFRGWGFTFSYRWNEIIGSGD